MFYKSLGFKLIKNNQSEDLDQVSLEKIVG